MPTFTPHHRRVVCPKCSSVFAQGYGYNKHARYCDGGNNSDDSDVLPAEEEDDPTDIDFDLGMDSSDDEAEGDMEVGHEDEQTTSIEDHLTRMEELGTLDLDHVLYCHKWGKVAVQDNEVEVCRFLRSTEVGGGASNTKSTAALLYAKSLGGRGDLLPKTMKTCWAKVDRVCRLLYNVHPDVRFVFFVPFILYSLSRSLCIHYDVHFISD
jgi:hypothetical protein